MGEILRSTTEWSIAIIPGTLQMYWQEFNDQLCHFPAVWPWKHYCSVLSLFPHLPLLPKLECAHKSPRNLVTRLVMRFCISNKFSGDLEATCSWSMLWVVIWFLGLPWGFMCIIYEELSMGPGIMASSYCSLGNGKELTWTLREDPESEW